MTWTTSDIPDLSDRIAVVTGANSGIGFHAARELAAHGARVVLAVRDASGKGAAAAERIREQHGGADVVVEPLDLADLASVRAFAERWSGGLDLLVNNAGVMATPLRRTADGFELQLGTNHLGHFALTGLLLPRLLERPAARVVNVSSTMAEAGWMRFDDLNWERHRYSKWLAYGQSKLANLLFTRELARRAARASLDLTVVACHPGYAHTNLQAAGPRMAGHTLLARGWDVISGLVGQSSEAGAWPTLLAATGDLAPAAYVGPQSLGGMRGRPGPARLPRRARDDAAARRLWEASEELTGVRYTALAVESHPVG